MFGTALIGRGVSMATLAKARSALAGWWAQRRAEVRLAGRVTVAGVATFALAEAMGLTQSYWAILTAIIIMQASVGGSLKAAIDRLLGTLSGAACGVAVAGVVPHHEPWGMALALAVALAPLALLAALNASFRVAPITAAIVLLGTVSQHGSLLLSAVERVLEIGLGSIVGLAVALLVLPARGHDVLTEAAGRVLDILGQTLPALLADVMGAANASTVRTLFESIRPAMTKLESATDEARRERRSLLSDAPDPDPFLRTLLRLRHDLVMIRRATVEPLPEPVRSRLTPALAQLSETAAAFLRGTGAALAARLQPPSLGPAEAAFANFHDELAAVRSEGLIRELSFDDAGRLYALSFALEQLHAHFADMAARTAESARHDTEVSTAT